VELPVLVKTDIIGVLLMRQISLTDEKNPARGHPEWYGKFQKMQNNYT
jgi:hypothetical protein